VAGERETCRCLKVTEMGLMNIVRWTGSEQESHKRWSNKSQRRVQVNHGGEPRTVA